MCDLCHVMCLLCDFMWLVWSVTCVLCVMSCDIWNVFVLHVTYSSWHVACDMCHVWSVVMGGDWCLSVTGLSGLTTGRRPGHGDVRSEDKRTCWALRSNKWSSSVYSGHRPNTAATLTRIPEWLKHCVRNNKAWVLRREMHAGGVAESSGPWNDDKDPFEVWRQYWTNPFPLLFTVNVRKRSKSGYFLW